MTAEITEHDIELFMYGSCYQLAEAIHDLTGWPIYAFWDEYYRDYDIHAFIKQPGGLYIDVLGWHTARELKQTWECSSIRKVRKSYDFRGWDTFNPFYDSSDRAREILPALIPEFCGVLAA